MSCSPFNEPIGKVSKMVFDHPSYSPDFGKAVLIPYWRLPFLGLATAKCMEDVNRDARSAETRNQESRVMGYVRRSLVPYSKNHSARWGLPAPSVSASALRLVDFYIACSVMIHRRSECVISEQSSHLRQLQHARTTLPPARFPE